MRGEYNEMNDGCPGVECLANVSTQISIKNERGWKRTSLGMSFGTTIVFGILEGRI